MPLLMKAQTEHLPSETTLEIPGGEARAFHAHQGQLLSIVDLAGQQPATLFAFVTNNLKEFLSPHHTRVFSNSFLLNLGMRLVTNHRRPIMVLGKDTVGTHDLLWPALDARYLSSQGLPDTNGCVENAKNALARLGVVPPRLPDPVNLFLNVKSSSHYAASQYLEPGAELVGSANSTQHRMNLWARLLRSHHDVNFKVFTIFPLSSIWIRLMPT